MAKIYNSNSNTLVSGTSGKDTIQNGGYDKSGVYQSAGSYVTIQAGAGNDSVSNNGGDNVIIDGGKGNDSLQIDHGSYDSIFGGDGNDYIYAQADLSTISGGAGNDSIIVKYGAKLSIDGGAGDDFIEFMSGEEVAGDNSTISGGKGNDIIRLDYRDRYGVDAKNVVINYASGDGNDTVYGFNSNDTLHITKGSYTTTKSGTDFIVQVGKQKITLKDALADGYGKINIENSSGKVAVYNDWKVREGNVNGNYANKVTLTGSKFSDYISNYGDNVKITGGAGRDLIASFKGNNVTISGGEGDEQIQIRGGDNLKISGDAGTDRIYVDDYVHYSTIDGGNGDDYIYLDMTYDSIIKGDNGDDYIGVIDFSGRNTIDGGKGNDRINLDPMSSQNVIKYASGDGNDTVFGFFADDTLHITKGSYSAKASGNDVIVTVGKGKITLNNAAGKSISIKDSKGKVTTKTYGSSSSALFTEDNFVTADNLSAIVENKLTATDYKISAQNFESLSQEKLITFAEK